MKSINYEIEIDRQVHFCANFRAFVIRAYLTSHMSFILILFMRKYWILDNFIDDYKLMQLRVLTRIALSNKYIYLFF